MAVGKHFPGIGRTFLDSHQDLPDLDTDARSLAEVDRVPFQAAVDCGAAGIMLSHIRYMALDPKWPASLSPPIADGILRRHMADDLDMGAIVKHYPLPTIVRQCLDAGVDILLICHAGPKIPDALDHILALRKTSAELIRKEEKSLRRILHFKELYIR